MMLQQTVCSNGDVPDSPPVPLLLQASPRGRRRLVPSTQLVWVGQCALQPPAESGTRAELEAAPLEGKESSVEFSPRLDTLVSERGSRHAETTSLLADPLGGIIDLPQFRPREPRDHAPVASKIYNGTVVRVPRPRNAAFISSSRTAYLSVQDPEARPGSPTRGNGPAQHSPRQHAVDQCSIRVRPGNIGTASHDHHEGAKLDIKSDGCSNTQVDGIDAAVGAGAAKPSAGSGLRIDPNSNLFLTQGHWHFTFKASTLPPRKPVLFSEPYVENKTSILVRETRKPPQVEDDEASSDDDNGFFYQPQGWLPAGREYDSEVLRARRELRERAMDNVTRLKQRHEQELRKFQRHQESRGNLSSFSLKVKHVALEREARKRKDAERKRELEARRKSVIQRDEAKAALSIFQTEKGQARRGAQVTLAHLRAEMRASVAEHAENSNDPFLAALQKLAQNRPRASVV